MTTQYTELLKGKMSAGDFQKLETLNNDNLWKFVGDAAELCEPEKVLLFDDSKESLAETRAMAMKADEEQPLAIDGHTFHFDGIRDQGRDRESTKYLVPQGQSLSKALNQAEREAGLGEVRELLRGAMKGRSMLVRFLTLGPNKSVFSIPCVECTDSWYVSHSLDLLYRQGYGQFASQEKNADFFGILHSSGRLNELMASADPDKKRIYIDHTVDRVYSVNSQYAGNTVGLKKLALRLTIRKADEEGWLAEHMFLMRVKGPGGRGTYIAGAYPSACGKTSTAMLPGELITGDDIAYFRAIEGECRAVNAEAGIFGIIQNVNAKDDPAIWDVLHKPGEVIFSNILVKDKTPYWLGMGEDIPEEGINFSGQWHKGKKDDDGSEIPPAHKNARYCVALNALANCDPELQNPNGVALSGIVYGGRDAKSYLPVQQSFDWEHGVVAYGASLETETTFATIGKEGVPEINLMSIQDFVSIPLGKYIANNLDFGGKLKHKPLIFGTNYFLRGKDGKFVNGIRDKHVWVKWMELRIHGDAGAIKTPTGWIPKFEDIKPLFKELVGKDYQTADYLAQFTLRVPENLAKLDRVEKFHREQVENAPRKVFEVLAAQRTRLDEARKQFGDYIEPGRFPIE